MKQDFKPHIKEYMNDTIQNMGDDEKHPTHLARVHSFETFGTVDGPGVRFVVFFWGCLLRCLFCHNPDTWATKNYTLYNCDELLKEIMKYKNFFSVNGGVTFSGGEPLKHFAFLYDFLPLLKAQNVNVVIDTSGAIYNPVVEDLIENYVDMVLLDIKAFYPDVYNKLTSYDLEPTLKLLSHLKKCKKRTWIRYVLVPGITDDLKMIKDMVDYLQDYKDIIEKIELLPFHKMGEFKWKELGLDYKLTDTPIPSKDLIKTVKQIFSDGGFSCP